MSYDFDSEGNKVFYEPELERERNLKSYRVTYSGVAYVEAYDEEHAYDQALNLIPEFDDLEVSEE